MPRFIDIITADEKQKINSLIADGTLNETNMPTFVDSFVRAPDRKTAFEHARDNTLVARIHRDITGIDKAFRDPGIGIRAAEKFFEEKGAVRGAGELAWSAVTTPIRAWGGILGGKGLGQRPLETLVGAASVIPVGRAVAGLTSGGLRAGARAAAGAGQATRAATLTGTADDLSRLTSARGWTPTAQALEVADVVVGAEEWPLELAAEGMLEGAAQVGRLTSRRSQQAQAEAEATEATAEHDTITGSQTTPAPPADPTQPSRDVQQRVLDQLAEEQAAQQEAQQQAQQQAQAEFEQFAEDYGPFYADITKRDGIIQGDESLQRMQSEFEGGVRDPIQTRYDAIATSIQENNPDITPERLQEETDIVLRSQIGDQWVDQFRGIEPEAPPTPAERLQKMVDAADDMIEGDDEQAPELRRSERLAEIAREVPAPGSEPEPDIEMTPEEEAQYLEDLENNFIESMTEWMVQYNPDVNAVEEIVDDALKEGYQMGELAEEDAQAIRPGVIAAIRERLPQAIADAEATTAREAEIDDTIENTIGNVKYKKANYTFTFADGSERAVDGYTVENTGIDFAEIFLTKEGNQWLAIDPNTQMRLAGHETYPNREQAVRAAMRSMLFYGEAAYQRTAVEEETADEREPETQQADETPETTTQPSVDEESAPTTADEVSDTQPDIQPAIQPMEERDWAGLDAEITTEALNTLQENPGADPRAVLNIIFDRLITGGTISERDSYQLRPLVEQLVESGRTTPEEATPPSSNDEAQIEITDEHVEKAVEELMLRYGPSNRRNTPDMSVFDADLEYIADTTIVHYAMQGTPGYDFNDTSKPARIELARRALARFREVIAEREQRAAEAVPPAEASVSTLAALIQVSDYPDGITPEKKLEDAIFTFLEATDSPLTAEDLFAGATAAYGKDQYNSQAVYDVMEVAVNRYIASQQLMNTVQDPTRAKDMIQRIMDVEGRLPRQADRTAEREANQQYSTPFHYAFLVNWVANLSPDDVVLEPSAGTGNLAWYAKVSGAEVHVNDIGKIRRRLLSENFDNTTNVDATQIDKRLPNVQPTLVVMNPPFSSTQGQKKNMLLGVNMVEAALKTLQPGGRIVAIVNGGRDLTDAMKTGEKPGGGPNFDSQSYKKWWNRIGNNYMIRANVHVSGDVYRAFGTSFNTRLLVIDKPLPGENPNPLRNQEGLKPQFQAMHKQRVDTILEAVDLLEGVRNERSIDAEQQRSEQTRQTPPVDDTGGRTGTPESDGDATPPVSVDPDRVVSESGESAVSPGESTDASGEVGGADVRHDTTRGVDVAGASETPPSDTTGDDTAQGSVRGDRDTQDATVLRDARTGGSDLDTIDPSQTWVPVPESHIIKGKPVQLMETISLATVASPDVENVNVNIPNEFLQLYSDAQKKVIRLALRAHEAHIEPQTVGDTPPRRGFYLGWDTGTGKTWVNAGAVIHNQNLGRRKHIYITQTQDLINDFMEAFPIAGGDLNTTFNINDGLKPSGVLISTYATLAGKLDDNTRLSEMLEFATGMKPPESLLRPQTDVELLSFGELPRTFALAFNAYNAGQSLPEEVQDVMSRFKQHQQATGQSAAKAPKEWTDQYKAIVQKSDALIAAEGGISAAQWMENATDFDGVLIFDEAHSMKNDKATSESDPSATARKGKLLAELLPNARVIYASATGTTEIANLSYMERLGIWGRDKPFANPNSFIMEMERGGIASQEVVARDLKAKGLFHSYSQDFSDVVVRSMVHELTDEQTQMYNDFANVWQQIRLYLMDYQAEIREMQEESEERVSAKGVGVSWSNFYNKQQTFFKAMLATFKMQSVIPDMIQQVEAGKKVTMQVISTYEANQQRQEQRARRAGTDVGDVEITAREILEEYLDEDSGALPVYSHEIVTDARSGETAIRRITNDTDEVMTMQNGQRVPPGAPIPNMDLVRKRDALVELLYRSHLPPPPIDQVIQAFKERNIEVAEITGRKKRFYFNAAGERIEETLNPNKTGELARRFNENDIRVLIFSKKGATGANYPATDPRHPIVQYVIDIGWEADKFKQGLGRSKRSNEVAAPEIVNTATNMVGELRFQSTAASRAAEMGATTRGQAQEGTGLDLFTFDAKYLNSDYGKQALYSFLYEMYRGHVFEVPGETNPDGTPMRIGWYEGEGVESFYRVTGIEVKEDSKGKLDFFRVGVNQFLNRVLGAPSIAIQNALYNNFFRRLNNLLQEAEANDTLDKGVETLPTLSAHIQEETTIYTDPDSQAQTFATSVAIEEEPNYIHYESDLISRNIDYYREINDRVASFYVRSDDQIFFDEQTASRTDESGKVIQRIRRTSPRGYTRYFNLDNAYPPDAGTRHILFDLSDEQIAEFAQEWEAEIAALPPTRKSTRMLVRGLMTDVWDKINPPVYGQDSNRVARELAQRKLVRIVLDNEQNIVGRMFTDQSEFQEMLGRFGLASDAVEAAKQVANAADVQTMIEDGWTIQLSDELRVRQRTRAGQPYFAVEGSRLRLEGLADDNVVQKFRPSGGAMTYILPVGNITSFLDTYPPLAALKGNNQIELEYDTDTQSPRGDADDQGGQGGNTPDIPPDSGSEPGTPANNAAARVATETRSDVSEDTSQVEADRATRTARPTGSPRSPQPERIRERLEREEAERATTVEKTAEVVQRKLSSMDMAEALSKTPIFNLRSLRGHAHYQGKDDDFIRTDIQRQIQERIEETDTPQALEETPEDAEVLAALGDEELTIDEIIKKTGLDRNVVAQSIIRLRNTESEYGVGEGGQIERFKADDNYIRFRKVSETTQEEATEAPTDDPTELLSRLQSAEIQQTDNQSGLLTFALGPQVTAEIKKGNYDNMKSGLVRFYLSDTSPPVEKHYRGKALSPENIVDTLRKELTADEVQSALGQPVTIDGVTYTPETFQLRLDTTTIEAEGYRLEGHRHDYAQLIVHPQYETNKKGGARFNPEYWILSEINTGLAVPGSVRNTRQAAVVAGLERLDVVGEERFKQAMETAMAKLQETPDRSTSNERDNAEENARTAKATAKGRETDSASAAPIQPAETSDSKQDDGGGDDVRTPTRQTPDDGSENIPDIAVGGDRTYHGATFREENGRLIITGEEIPESFWNYWHSGGRGRGSAHKKAMKTGGWRYSFQGSKPRVYSFSISVSDFERWKAKNPDDGSDPVEETYSPAPGTSKEQQAIDYLETLRGHVRARVDAGSTPERAIISVRHDLSERVYNEQDVYYAGDRLEAHPDYPPESRGEGRPRPEAWIEDRLREGLPEQTQQEMAARAAAVPSEDEIKATVLSKLESGDYTQQDGYHYEMDIEGAGKVDVSLHTVGTATYDIGGLSEMSYETKIDIRSKEDPTTFKWITLKMPQALVEKHDTQFLDEFLDAYKDRDNWERLGRRNAFKHTPSGAYVSFKKDGNRYEATFSEFPRLGVKFVRVDGDTLEERLQNALDELKPFMFRFNDLEKITDTLRHETGQPEARHHDDSDRVTSEEITDESTATEGDQQADSATQQESPGTTETESDAAGVENLSAADTGDTTGEETQSVEVISSSLENVDEARQAAYLNILGISLMQWAEADAAGRSILIQEALDKHFDEETGEYPEKIIEAEKALQPSIRGGAPLVQTFETIRAVPDTPDLDVSKKGLNRIPVGSRLQEKVDGVTPKMKLWLERSRREYLSGYKNLDTLGPVGAALRDAAEYALDIQDRGSIIDLRMLEPHQKALVDLSKKRTPKGASREVVGAAMSEQIFRFIEENTPIDNDVELLKVAQGWKEAWRKILTRHVAHMLQIRKEIEALPGNERVVIRRSDGSTSKDWSPLLPGHTWNDEQQMFERGSGSDKKLLTPEDAIAQSDRLYMPHNYPTSHWNAIVDQVNVNKIISKLDAAVGKKGNKLPGFTYNKSNNTYTFDRTGNSYDSKQAAADGAKQYWTEQYALAQEQLAGKETSVIGRYGHLELARETTDKLYMRDVSMLLDHSQMFWHRLGEIAVWGQYDPVLGNWPRLAQYIARIGETALSQREKALMTVADILMNHESDMFERLPSFREGETTAANIMRYWRTPDLEKMRADNPDAFTDEVLDTLVEVGFAEQVNGTYKLRGASEDAQRATFIRHMVPHFQTMHLREETVLKIVRGIGHWENNDELNSNSGRFWSGLNHITTTLTLGLGTSIQNIGEIPLLATVTGSKNVISGIKRLTTDKAFREMLPQLGAALSRARDYLADTDTQSKYLNFVLFTPTEKWSRLTGVAVGWEAAKDAISKYLQNPSKGNRSRLEELNISVKAIDNYRSVLPAGEAPAFEELVKEAEGRVLEGAMMMGGLRKPDAPAPSNMHVDWVGDEMARAARYVSTRVFKGYNALSLPSFLTKKDPMIRTFFKFKSWAAQMHQFMWEQFGYARKQAMQGNWAPAWRLAQGFVGMGVSSAMILAFFNAMAGREDDDKNKVLQSIAQAHTLGVGSMLMEIAIYADGSPYKAAHILNSALGSPTAGVFSRVGAEVLSGDVAGAGQTAFWQLPFLREAKRFGGGAAKAIQGE